MEKKTFYITTPIYYPSDKLHIGHSYCASAFTLPDSLVAARLRGTLSIIAFYTLFRHFSARGGICQ